MADLSPFATLPSTLTTRGGIQVDRRFLPLVTRLAQQFGVKVNSGYRDPALNAEVGGATHSDHLSGDAVDFTGSPEAMRRLYTYAQGKFPYIEPWGQTGGSHVHISFARGSSTPTAPVAAQAPSAPTPVPGSPLAALVRSELSKFPGLDPAAVLAVASTEGLSGGIGDGGHAFGPFQLNNAGGVITGEFSGQTPEQIQSWATSPQGIDYGLSGIAKVARGLKGPQAVNAIVSGFERPADIPGEVAKANARLGSPTFSSPLPNYTSPLTQNVPGTLPTALVPKPKAALPLRLALQLLGVKPGGLK